MNKQQLQELYNYLDEVQAFLNDCDDGLAGEVSAKEKIAGRIYKAAGDMPRLKAMVMALIKKAE